MDNIIHLPGNISVNQVVGDFSNKINIDSIPTEDSNNPVSSNGVYEAFEKSNELALSIPLGTTESTSTETAFTAIVEEFADVTELKTGMAVFLKNTKIESATGWTLNIKRSASDTTGLGAKPVYVTTAAATRSTTQFALNYKYLFVYDESLNSSSGGWYICQLFNTNTTYTTMSSAQGTAGTDTTARLVRADYLKAAILKWSNLVLQASTENTLTAAAGNYYRFDSEVTSLAVTLPTVNTTSAQNIIIYLTTGTDPTITFTSTSPIAYQKGYALASNSTYEINCLSNGSYWLITNVEFVLPEPNLGE